MLEATVSRKQQAYGKSAVGRLYGTHKEDPAFSVSGEVFDATREGGIRGGVRRLYRYFSETKQQKPLKAALNTARTIVGSEIVTLNAGIDRRVAQILTQKEGLSTDETPLRRGIALNTIARAVSTLFYVESNSDQDGYSGVSGRSTTRSWGQVEQSTHYYRPNDSDASQAEWDS